MYIENEKDTLVVDIDFTILKATKNKDNKFDYENAKPMKRMIKKLQKLAKTHHIILFTARGMRTFNGDIEKIENHHKPILIKWLYKHNVPYNLLLFGKPWGKNVYYIDDKAMTPQAFLDLY